MEKNEKTVRDLLIRFLDGETHPGFDGIVAEFPMTEINTILPHGAYSTWHLLEHIRRTQNDILDFMINPKYASKRWPADYWPGKTEKGNANTWQTTVASYKADLRELGKIVLDPKTDLYRKISWGDGQTVMEEIIKVSDHTSYHLGELGILRQIMGTWPNHRKSR